LKIQTTHPYNAITFATIDTSGKQTSWEHTSLMGDFFFNTSILTGDYVTEYSQQARADANYDTSGGHPVFGIIRKLKSHDWYSQNPAVSGITIELLQDADKDSLFVLGRNLYQSACGDSKKADITISTLSAFLKRFDKEVAFHILNGILYEVYFDSSDRFREKKKSGKLDYVLNLEDDNYFALSFDFIQQTLLPHQKQLFYLPGNKRDVLVDVILSSAERNKLAVKQILIEGQDVFYSSDGTTLVANSEEEFLLSYSSDQFEKMLLEEMGIPRKHARITYTPKPLEGANLIIPHDYKIRRLGK
jgi:hypothetical protein